MFRRCDKLPKTECGGNNKYQGLETLADVRKSIRQIGRSSTDIKYRFGELVSLIRFSENTGTHQSYNNLPDSYNNLARMSAQFAAEAGRGCLRGLFDSGTTQNRACIKKAYASG